MNLLKNNLPVNLFPLTWLLPSGESTIFTASTVLEHFYSSLNLI